MHELLQKVLSHVRSSLRFRWYGMALAWLVCLIGWAVVAWLPNVYEASARVIVDTSSALAPVLRDQIITPDVETQLAYVRESLLGAERLDMVARSVGFYETALSPRDYEAVIRRLRDSIDLTTERSSPQTQTQTNIYLISYRDENRDTAIAVVQALYDAMIEETMEAQLAGTDTREGFISTQLAGMQRDLELAEQALAEFKRANADRLPGTEGDYFTRKRNEEEALEDLRRQLRILEAERRQIVAQLSGEALVVPGSPGSGQEPRPDSIDARIRDARIRLDELLTEYTEMHYDVIAQRQLLEQYEAQREAELNAVGVTDPDQELSGLTVNRVREELRIDLNETEVEIASLQEDIALSEAKVAELQGLIDEVPAIEAELTRLTRDYDVKTERYLALARSRETEELSRQASLTDQVDFKPVNPPNAPYAPVAPMRAILLAGVFVASLGAGGALCFLLAQLNPVFGSVREIQSRLGLPVVGVVTQAWEENYQQQYRRAIVAYGCALGALFVLFGGVAMFEIAGPGVHSLLQGTGS